MEVWADVSLRTFIPVRTLPRLIVLRMVLQFLPAMALLTCHVIVALSLVFRNEIIGIPLGARDMFIHVDIWLTAIVLPVVRINTVAPIMLQIVERTPKGLVMEDEEVHVSFVVVNQFHAYLVLSVGKGTIVAVLAILTVVRIMRTKFSFVFFDRVELFYLVVTLSTVFTIGTSKVVLLIFDMLSHVIFTF